MKHRKIVALVMCMSFAMVGCSQPYTEESELSQENSTTETEKRTLSEAVSNILDKYATTEVPTTTEKETTTEEQTTAINSEAKYEDIFLPENMRFGMAAAEIKDNETRYETFNPTMDDTEYISYRGTKNSYWEMDIECTYCCIKINWFRFGANLIRHHI